MSMSKNLWALLIAAIFGLGVFYFGGLSISNVPGFISTAEAVVGRPVTPVSVAGVARRSARRCAAGVTC